jgi:hypothetical protein
MHRSVCADSRLTCAREMNAAQLVAELGVAIAFCILPALCGSSRI